MSTNNKRNISIETLSSIRVKTREKGKKERKKLIVPENYCE